MYVSCSVVRPLDFIAMVRARLGDVFKRLPSLSNDLIYDSPMSSKRLKQESFRKRRNNFIRRGHEISDRYDVDVWICIRKNGQNYVYDSKPDDKTWPPTSKQLVLRRSY